MSRKIFSTIFFGFTCMFFVPLFVFASTTDGTIDSTYKYAWSENVGWINFGTSEGNVHVTDTAVTGYMWNENTGWINLAVSGSVYVANNADGTLSGYAWGEGVGYINFAGVTIDSDGFFHGYASSTLSGRINFNCIDLNTCGTSDFRTKTDWRKASVRNASSGSSSGGGGGGGATRSFSQQVVVQSTPVVTTVAPVSVPASSLSEGGLSGNLRPGDSGPRVTALQKFLNSQGYVVSASGAGSPGKEGTYFGNLTKTALSKFQLASGDAKVIAEKGFLGPKTITYMLAQLQQKIAQNAQTATTETVVSTACPAYLEKYIKSGAKNDMNEVKKLQKFLATDEGFDNLRSTGFYGAETFKAVTDFQNKYATDVLGPWNNNKPTGYVYQTTKKKINELYCMYRAKEKAAQ